MMETETNSVIPAMMKSTLVAVGEDAEKGNMDISRFIDTSEEKQFPKVPKVIFDPNEVLPVPPPPREIIPDTRLARFWYFHNMDRGKLKKIVKDSDNEYIQKLLNQNYKLTKDQKRNLSVYIASGGKCHDYTWLLNKNEKCSEPPYNHTP